MYLLDPEIIYVNMLRHFDEKIIYNLFWNKSFLNLLFMFCLLERFAEEFWELFQIYLSHTSQLTTLDVNVYLDILLYLSASVIKRSKSKRMKARYRRKK